MRYYGLIGAGGFGREVMPLLQSQAAAEVAAGSAEIYFVAEIVEGGPAVNGVKICSLDSFLKLSGDRYFNIAIGDSSVRERIAIRCEAADAKPLSIKASNVIVLAENKVSDGGIFCPFSMVTSNAHIGRYFHANIYSYVAHDCEIGDFVTFAPGVKCNGNVRVEDHAYIGTGAVLKQGTTGNPLVIGRGATVGMGAVVTKDVAPGSVVIGNPARPMVQR